MILVDLETHEFLENEELLTRFDQNNRYQDLIQRDTPLIVVEETTPSLDPGELNHLQHRFGYTREEVRMILAPMAAEGKDESHTHVEGGRSALDRSEADSQEGLRELQAAARSE